MQISESINCNKYYVSHSCEYVILYFLSLTHTNTHVCAHMFWEGEILIEQSTMVYVTVIFCFHGFVED
jgi:hypothetical protein